MKKIVYMLSFIMLFAVAKANIEFDNENHVITSDNNTNFLESNASPCDFSIFIYNDVDNDYIDSIKITQYKTIDSLSILCIHNINLFTYKKNNRVAGMSNHIMNHELIVSKILGSNSFPYGTAFELSDINNNIFGTIVIFPNLLDFNQSEIVFFEKNSMDDFQSVVDIINSLEKNNIFFNYMMKYYFFSNQINR